MAAETIAGRYRLEQPLGVGGMAEVVAAEDLELGRRVALKMLAPDADRERFRREAKAAAALAHPNIAQLYDYGESDGRPFMVLEYLAGGTLEDRLVAGRPLADAETARIAREIAAGLAHAHLHGVVHRDLKPGNVLFDAEGRAKIGDFGIARMGGQGTLTEAGTVLGTASYIAPEQGRGESATPASDVYSFGVILYRMLTGRLPFEAERPLDLVEKHISEEPPPLTLVRPDAPAGLAALATRALAKDPRARPADGAAVVAALDEGDPTLILPRAAAPTGETARPEPERRRRRAPAVAGLAAAVVLAAGGAALAVMATRTDDEPVLGEPTSPRDATTRRRTTNDGTATERQVPATPTGTAAATRTTAPPERPTTPVETRPPAVTSRPTTRVTPTVAPTTVAPTAPPTEPETPTTTDVPPEAPTTTLDVTTTAPPTEPPPTVTSG